MWPTVDGLRVLRGAEAELVKRCVTLMCEKLSVELHEDEDQHRYCIDWFDQWDCEQRIWLLQQVVSALFTRDAPLEPAAIFEATIDAIFCEGFRQIEDEIDASTSYAAETQWRKRTVDAFVQQHGRPPRIEPQDAEADRWRIVLTQITDMILGMPAYQKAEAFRDGDIKLSQRFLTQKGLPEDYLQRIPPFVSREQACECMKRIEEVVGES